MLITTMTIISTAMTSSFIFNNRFYCYNNEPENNTAYYNI